MFSSADVMRETRATVRAADSTKTQRGRLLAAMLAAVTADGYAGATVANVLARAGVSHSSFYEHFTDKEDCFLAVYRHISGCLLRRVVNALNDSSPERAVHVVVEELIEHAGAKPVQARFLVSDALTGGGRALQERARSIGHISSKVRAAHAIASTQTPAPDLPTRAVVGATQCLIAQRMCRGQRHHRQLGRELAEWLVRYERPIGDHRWSTLSPGPLPEPCLANSEIGDRLPPLVPPERSALIASDARSRRWRILFASADSAVQSGFAGSTLTAIMARAGLRKAAFYQHFADKRQAFLVLHELAFQQSMAVGANAYFGEKTWPERVSRCLIATSQFHAAHPAIAYIALVETHALGLPAIQRLEESRRAFTTLLLAESQNRSRLPSVTATEAIGAAIFEIAHERARQQRIVDLPAYAYHATYIALAPFLGVHAADRFVVRKLSMNKGR